MQTEGRERETVLLASLVEFSCASSLPEINAKIDLQPPNSVSVALPPTLQFISPPPPRTRGWHAEQSFFETKDGGGGGGEPLCLRQDRNDETETDKRDKTRLTIPAYLQFGVQSCSMIHASRNNPEPSTCSSCKAKQRNAMRREHRKKASQRRDNDNGTDGTIAEINETYMIFFFFFLM